MPAAAPTIDWNLLCGEIESSTKTNAELGKQFGVKAEAVRRARMLLRQKHQTKLAAAQALLTPPPPPPPPEPKPLPPPIPWWDIEQDYMNLNITVQDVAAKWGITPFKLVEHCTKRGILRRKNPEIRKHIASKYDDPHYVPPPSPTLTVLDAQLDPSIDPEQHPAPETMPSQLDARAVLQAHRVDIRRAHLITRRLYTHLEEHLRQHEPRSKAGEGLQMSGAALAQYAQAARTLADTLKIEVALEREALGIGATVGVDPLQQIKEMSTTDLLSSITVLMRETKLDVAMGIETTREASVTIERAPSDLLEASQHILEGDYNDVSDLM